jgi:hypothetical protein
VPKIIVASIDYDGCLSHPGYQQALEDFPDKPMPDVLMDNNPIIMEFLRSKHPLILMNGSNRQDVRTDFSNSNNSRGAIGSYFSMLEAIGEKIGEGTVVSPFVLTDLYADKEDGYASERAKKLHTIAPHQYPPGSTVNGFKGEPEWSFDDQKVSIVYAQIQKLSLAHPDDEIEYNFIDDREDILSSVVNFFAQHPEMIPGNVTLKIQRYYNANTDSKSTQAIMKLEEKVLPPSISEHSTSTKANPLYKETLKAWAQTWARKKKDWDNAIQGEEDNPKDFRRAYNNLASEHQIFFKQSQTLFTQIAANISPVLAGIRTLGNNLFESAKQVGSAILQKINSVFGTTKALGNDLFEDAKHLKKEASQNISSVSKDAKTFSKSLLNSAKDLGSTATGTLLTNTERREKKQAIEEAMAEIKKYVNQLEGARDRLKLQLGGFKDNYTAKEMQSDMNKMHEAIEKLKALKVPDGLKEKAKEYEFATDKTKLIWDNYKQYGNVQNGAESKKYDTLCKAIKTEFKDKLEVSQDWENNDSKERHNLHVNSEIIDPHLQQEMKQVLSEAHKANDEPLEDEDEGSTVSSPH